MKTKLQSFLLIIFLFLSTFSFSQVWDFVYDSIPNTGREVILTDDSCYLVTAINSSFEDGLSLKLDKSGNIIWYAPFGGSGITQTYDGKYIIANDNSTLRKIDGSGNLEWNKFYGGEDQEDFLGIIHSSDSCIIACGYSANHGDSTYFVIKTDSAGNLHWTKSFKSQNIGFFYDMVEFDDHYYIVGNEHSDYPFQSSLFIVKLTMSGITIWEKFYQIGLGGMSVAVTPDSALIVTGANVLTRLNLEGDTIWTKKLNEEWSMYAVDVTPDGGYIVSGRGPINDPVNLLARFEADGDIIWSQLYPSISHSDMASFESVKYLPDNGYIACGYSGYDREVTRLRVLKTDSTGNILVNISGPDQKNQSLIYPNPSDGKIVIDIEGITHIEIFDIKGRKFQTSARDNEIDLGNCEKGIYIARITTAEGIYIRKIIKK